MRQVQEVKKIEFSKEIITEKATMDTMIAEKISFESELKNLRQNHDQDVSNRLQVKKQQDHISRLESDKLSNEQQARSKEESLLDNIREAKNNNAIKKKELKDAQSEIYETKRSEQSAKMLADASKY